MDDFQGKSACLTVSCVNMPVLRIFPKQRSQWSDFDMHIVISEV